MMAVSAAIQEVADVEVTPRFGALRSSDVVEKSPGELVTEADRACELALTERLRTIRNVPVVGEEATADAPSLVDQISMYPSVWLVDPLDGTSNFISGSIDHAVMVALIEDGLTVASWMWQPATGVMAHAVLGGGAWINGQRVVAADSTSHASEPRGVLKKRFLPPDIRRRVETDQDVLAAATEGSNCAGVDYPHLVGGRWDFLIYWRVLPWDHAPGVLLAQEAGMQANRLDGDRYVPGSDLPGLLVAHPAIWSTIRDLLTSDSVP